MKYTSILAGVFGLMALAACTNNDEVTMEQPKQVHTITVAYNKSADTRVQLSSSEDFFKTRGFKGTWESDDQIKLVAEEGGEEYIYSIVAETIDEESGTATFTREGKPADGTYKVVYPADWDGNLDSFDTQDAEFCVGEYEDENQGQIKFDANKYLYALGTAELDGGSFKKAVTLTPIFNFIYMYVEYEFNNMFYWFDGNTEGVYTDSNEYPVWKPTVQLLGDNLFSKIEGFEGKMGKSYTLKDYDPEAGKVVEYEVPMIELNNFSVRYLEENDNNYWESYTSLIFAFPVLPGKPVTNLELLFNGKSCNVVNTDRSPATFTEGGHVYSLEAENLQFGVPK